MRGSRFIIPIAFLLTTRLAYAELPTPLENPTPDQVADARASFVEGNQHAADERWWEAEAAFSDSYRLSGSPVALYNLASALRHLGRFVDASEAVERFLTQPGLESSERSAAQRLLAELAPQLARITIDGVPSGRATVIADGESRDETARPIDIALDPGPHSLRVELEAHEPWTWNGSIEAGAIFQLDATLEPLGESGSSVFEQSAFWAIVGGVLAVVAAVVVIVVVDASLQLSARTPNVIELP